MPRRPPPFDGARIFGERVRLRRHELGLSQEALASRAGLHWTYVGSVERGGRNIALRNVLRLAEGLQVDAAVLVAGLRSGDV